MEYIYIFLFHKEEKKQYGKRKIVSSINMFLRSPRKSIFKFILLLIICNYHVDKVIRLAVINGKANNRRVASGRKHQEVPSALLMMISYFEVQVQVHRSLLCLLEDDVVLLLSIYFKKIVR